MASIEVSWLSTDIPFGARISGVTEEVLENEDVRQQLLDVFEKRGLIVFENMEPSAKLQLAVSNVFGPLKDHPIKLVGRVNQNTMPGVIEIRYDPAKSTIVEIDGRERVSWLPWHFDHCYNNELNRGAVLRAIDIPPEGGMTGFADGIQLYKSLSPKLLEKIEGCNILYRFAPDSMMRFGTPKSYRVIRAYPEEVIAFSKTLPRAVHPAVWTRKSGEKVLHVSPWMSLGIEGHEDPEGYELLSAVCEEIWAKTQPYFHKWRSTDMLIWDNWRMLHSVSGSDPKYPRLMHRTTIKGDYGLGYFENNGAGHVLLETTV
jgi:taurine dioxygenase